MYISGAPLARCFVAGSAHKEHDMSWSSFFFFSHHAHVAVISPFHCATTFPLVALAAAFPTARTHEICICPKHVSYTVIIASNSTPTFQHTETLSLQHGAPEPSLVFTWGLDTKNVKNTVGYKIITGANFSLKILIAKIILHVQ